MATLVFQYDHARDPMNPDDLADKLATQFNLNTIPVVNIDQTSITITHPQATEANRTAIQNTINAYVLDPVRAAYGPGGLGSLLNKAQKALTTNGTFLALPSPTNAQTLAQVQALTRELNALIKIAIGMTDDQTGT